MKIKNRTTGFTAYLYLTALAAMLAASCSNTKKLAPNQSLYVGATIKMTNSTAGSKENKALKASLQGLTRPHPNSKILGMRIKLAIYNMAGAPKPGKKQGWLKKLLRKYGEPPVLLNQVNLGVNDKILANYLENRGYFHAKVSGDTSVKNKKATAIYSVQTGPQYTIKDVYFPNDSSKISNAIQAIAPKTLLKKDAPFNLDVIKDERTRIDASLKEEGYYFFSPDELILDVDSTIGNEKVNMYVKYKPGLTTANTHAYTINDVYIYSNYNLNTAKKDTLRSDSVDYKGYHIIDRKNTFKPAVFDRIMVFSPGDLYNRRDHDLSLSRLINLGTFKFVKNRFQPVADTFKLNAFYYLTPLQKKSLSLEVGADTKSDNVTGSDLTLRWRNRNAFRGAELLSFSGYVGTEVQYSGQFSGYNTFRTGAEANLSIPRFVIPVFHFNTSGSFVPRTNMQLGYDILNRQKLFTLNSYRGQLGYSWKENIKKEHTLNPIAITLVQPLNVTKLYADSIKGNPILERAIQKQFILGSNYNFNYNELIAGQKYPGGLYFNGLVDLSGNLAGLLIKGNPKVGDSARLFGEAFAQYIKAEADTRYYIKLGPTAQWANRLILGFGLPYGNSSQLPYTKQFFVGGNNSLRGFRSRSVGPGTYDVGEKVSSKGFLPEATGDMKLEMNTELRKKLYSIFDGALFVDAGNIWLYKADSLQPGGKFTKDFLKQLAVDAGVGLRIDLTILMLRLDVAVPIRKPFLPPGQRAVISNLSEGNYRRQNIVYNLAIGLPF